MLEDLLYPSNHPEVEVEVANPSMEVHNHPSSRDLCHTPLFLLLLLLGSSNLEMGVAVDLEHTCLHVRDHQYKHLQEALVVVEAVAKAKDQYISVGLFLDLFPYLSPFLFLFPSPFLYLVPSPSPFHVHAHAHGLWLNPQE